MLSGHFLVISASGTVDTSRSFPPPLGAWNQTKIWTRTSIFEDLKTRQWEDLGMQLKGLHILHPHENATNCTMVWESLSEGEFT